MQNKGMSAGSHLFSTKTIITALQSWIRTTISGYHHQQVEHKESLSIKPLITFSSELCRSCLLGLFLMTCQKKPIRDELDNVVWSTRGVCTYWWTVTTDHPIFVISRSFECHKRVCIIIIIIQCYHDAYALCCSFLKSLLHVI